MTLNERFKEYVKGKLDDVDFDSIFSAIADKQEYCTGELLYILSLAHYYSQIFETKSNFFGEIVQYEHLLSDPDRKALLTVPRLLYIVTLCSKLRDTAKKPKSYDNLYL